jgi:glucokinase
VVTPEVIGIDLGGTAIKLGRFTADGTCLKSLTVATPQPATPEAVIVTMVDAIAQLDPLRQAVAIGVGTPGPADATRRVAKLAINLPGWVDVPLADALEAKIGKPTILDNDANCAGLGEAWLGSGRHFQHFILLTLGTGVGGAIFIDNKLFVGHYGAAGELGLITFNPDGPMCNSGNRGSLEQHVSITAIRRRTGKEPSELSVLAQSGDAAALNFWQEYGRDLGIGLTSLTYVLTPQAIIIGGGVSASAKFFLPAAKAEIEKRVLPTSRVDLQILPAELGNSAGMLGAARLAWEMVERGMGKGDTGD